MIFLKEIVIPVRQLTEEGRQVLLYLQNAIKHQQICYIAYANSWEANFCSVTGGTITVVASACFPAKVLNPYFEIVACMVQKCHMESWRYFGREPSVIHVPYTKQHINWLFPNSDL